MNHRPADILLIPGWGATGRVWDRFLAGYPEARSSHLMWNDCLTNGPQAVQKALETLPGRCVLLGWSLGALLALRAALEFPDRIERVVLISGTARMPEDEGYAGTDPRILRAMRTRLTRDAEGVLSEFSALCAEPDGTTAVREEYREMALTWNRQTLAAGLEALGSIDLRGRLSEVSVPVLLIHGSRDAVISLGQAEALVSNLPDARLDILEGYGHALPFTAADKLIESVRRFLA